MIITLNDFELRVIKLITVGLVRDDTRFGTIVPGVRLPLGPPPVVDRQLIFVKITLAEPRVASQRYAGIKVVQEATFYLIFRSFKDSINI